MMKNERFARKLNTHLNYALVQSGISIASLYLRPANYPLAWGFVQEGTEFPGINLRINPIRQPFFWLFKT